MKWIYHEFEELTGRQVYEMLKLRVDTFIVEQDCAYHELDNYDYQAIHLFCADEDRLVAYARLLPAGVKYLEPSVGRVVVKHDRRGTGLAHELLEESIDYIKNQWKPEKICLQAQCHLTNFYNKHGFEKNSEPYDADGIPHIDMILMIEEK